MNNFHNFPFFLEILTHFDKLTVNGVKTLKYGLDVQGSWVKLKK